MIVGGSRKRGKDSQQGNTKWSARTTAHPELVSCPKPPWALLGRSKNAILCLECNALRARTAGDSLTGASSRSNPGARTGPRGLYAPRGKHFHVGCARDGTGLRIGTAAGGLWLGFRARIWLPGNLDPKISEPARPDSPAALPRGRPPRLQLRSVWRYAVSVLHPSGTHFHRTAV